MRVEFSFSTPTTWRNPAMIESISDLIKNAGYADGNRYTVRMALTEAEAAAIEASTTQYRNGDIFLICDSGGGTTDVNVLRVKSTDRKIELEPLDHVEGVPVGSTLIDFHMGNHIIGRLELIKDHLVGDIAWLAEEMLGGKFQTIKHSFPNPVVDEFWLDVKGLMGVQTFPQAGITNSRMSINRATLQAFFDSQLREIFTLIDGRLMALQEDMPGAQVSYIVLSGGFGSSPYLYEEMNKRYQMNAGFSSRNTANTRIMKVLEPQLAVVRGLVKERTQQLGTPAAAGQDAFQTRRCRNSYGTITRGLYDPMKHQGLPFTTDSKDGRQWVEHVIDWFITRGEEVKVTDGVSREYHATIPVDQAGISRQATIVMSKNDANNLPFLSTDPACRRVACVKYTLKANDMKLKNRQIWKTMMRKQKYWRADFHFKVILGPADLKFEIVGKNGLLSSGHDSLDIDYEDPFSSRPQTQRPMIQGTTLQQQSTSPFSPSASNPTMPQRTSPTVPPGADSMMPPVSSMSAPQTPPPPARYHVSNPSPPPPSPAHSSPTSPGYQAANLPVPPPGPMQTQLGMPRYYGSMPAPGMLQPNGWPPAPGIYPGLMVDEKMANLHVSEVDGAGFRYA